MSYYGTKCNVGHNHWYTVYVYLSNYNESRLMPSLWHQTRRRENNSQKLYLVSCSKWDLYLWLQESTDSISCYYIKWFSLTVQGLWKMLPFQMDSRSRLHVSNRRSMNNSREKLSYSYEHPSDCWQNTEEKPILNINFLLI